MVCHEPFDFRLHILAKGGDALPQVTISDISLKDYNLTPRVSNLKDVYFKALPEICIDRPRLITRFHLENGLFKQRRISIIDKARAYRYVLEHRTPIVRHICAYEKGMNPFKFKDDSLFAGSTTSKFKGFPYIQSSLP